MAIPAKFHEQIISELLPQDAKFSGALIGTAASPGIARGPAFLCPCGQRLAIPQRTINETELPHELERLEAAIRDAEHDLQTLQDETSRNVGKKEAEIFEVQKLLLHDATFRNEITGRCLRKRVNVEAALDGPDVAKPMRTVTLVVLLLTGLVDHHTLIVCPSLRRHSPRQVGNAKQLGVGWKRALTTQTQRI